MRGTMCCNLLPSFPAFDDVAYNVSVYMRLLMCCGAEVPTEQSLEGPPVHNSCCSRAGVDECDPLGLHADAHTQFDTPAIR